MTKIIPQRGLLLVRPVETDETAPGGRILLIAETRERMTAHQCEVIAVGESAICDPTKRVGRKCPRAHATQRHDIASWQPTPTSMVTTFEYVRVHPCNVRPGDWLLVRPRAFIDSPHPERKEWFLHQDDVYAILGREG